MTSKLCCLLAFWTSGRDVLIASLPLLFWQLFSWKLHRYESVNKPSRCISYLSCRHFFFEKWEFQWFQKRIFFDMKGNILLFWVKLAGLPKCIHISALTAWSTNKKKATESDEIHEIQTKCITTYVSSLLEVQTIVPTEKKRR